MGALKLNEAFLDLQNYGLLRGANSIEQLVDEKSNEVVKIYAKIENDVVVDLKYKVFGPVGLIVCAEQITLMLKNYSFEQIRSLNLEELSQTLLEFDKACASRAKFVVDAILFTIDCYEEKLRKELIKQLKKEGKEIPEELKVSKLKDKQED